MDEEVSAWLAQAEEDFKTARILIEAQRFYAAAFFCQQSSEKALKALFIEKFDELVKVHDLVFLSRRLQAPKHLTDDCSFLNTVYVESRYPGDFEIPANSVSNEDAKKAYDIAKQVLSWVKKQLS